MHHRSRTASRRHNEGLDAEAANEIGYPSALVIGREVALVPRQAKGRIGQLENPLACKARDFVLRILPAKMTRKTLERAASYEL